jgi:hypothetical protein
MFWRPFFPPVGRNIHSNLNYCPIMVWKETTKFSHPKCIKITCPSGFVVVAVIGYIDTTEQMAVGLSFFATNGKNCNSTTDTAQNCLMITPKFSQGKCIKNGPFPSVVVGSKKQ